MDPTSSHTKTYSTHKKEHYFVQKERCESVALNFKKRKVYSVKFTGIGRWHEQTSVYFLVTEDGPLKFNKMFWFHCSYMSLNPYRYVFFVVLFSHFTESVFAPVSSTTPQLPLSSPPCLSSFQSLPLCTRSPLRGIWVSKKKKKDNDDLELELVFRRWKRFFLFRMIPDNTFHVLLFFLPWVKRLFVFLQKEVFINFKTNLFCFLSQNKTKKTISNLWSLWVVLRVFIASTEHFSNKNAALDDTDCICSFWDTRKQFVFIRFRWPKTKPVAPE